MWVHCEKLQENNFLQDQCDLSWMSWKFLNTFKTLQGSPYFIRTEQTLLKCTGVQWCFIFQKLRCLLTTRFQLFFLPITRIVKKNFTGHCIKVSKLPEVQWEAKISVLEEFDLACNIEIDVENLLALNVPLKMYTEILSICDILSKATIPAERRWTNDLCCVKNDYNNRNINEVFLNWLNHNIADALTK